MKNQIDFFRFLGVRPVTLNARYLSPQERDRCFWGNLPYMHNLLSIMKKSGESALLNDHLHSNLRRIATVKKLRTVTTNHNSLMQGIESFFFNS